MAKTIELLEEALTGQIIGAFFDVYNYHGFGFLEAVYHRSLLYELRARGFEVQSEPSFRVDYKGRFAGTFRPDLVVEGRVVVELKSTLALADSDLRQLVNALQASGIKVGLLLHFGAKPEHHRVVWTREHREVDPRRFR